MSVRSINLRVDDNSRIYSSFAAQRDDIQPVEYRKVDPAPALWDYNLRAFYFCAVRDVNEVLELANNNSLKNLIDVEHPQHSDQLAEKIVGRQVIFRIAVYSQNNLSSPFHDLALLICEQFKKMRINHYVVRVRPYNPEQPDQDFEEDSKAEYVNKFTKILEQYTQSTTTAFSCIFREKAESNDNNPYSEAAMSARFHQWVNDPEAEKKLDSTTIYAGQKLVPLSSDHLAHKIRILCNDQIPPELEEIRKIYLNRFGLYLQSETFLNILPSRELARITCNFLPDENPNVAAVKARYRTHYKILEKCLSLISSTEKIFRSIWPHRALLSTLGREIPKDKVNWESYIKTVSSDKKIEVVRLMLETNSFSIYPYVKPFVYELSELGQDNLMHRSIFWLYTFGNIKDGAELSKHLPPQLQKELRLEAFLSIFSTANLHADITHEEYQNYAKELLDAPELLWKSEDFERLIKGLMVPRTIDRNTYGLHILFGLPNQMEKVSSESWRRCILFALDKAPTLSREIMKKSVITDDTAFELLVDLATRDFATEAFEQFINIKQAQFLTSQLFIRSVHHLSSKCAFQCLDSLIHHTKKEWQDAIPVIIKLSPSVLSALDQHYKDAYILKKIYKKLLEVNDNFYSLCLFFEVSSIAARLAPQLTKSEIDQLPLNAFRLLAFQLAAAGPSKWQELFDILSIRPLSSVEASKFLSLATKTLEDKQEWRYLLAGCKLLISMLNAEDAWKHLETIPNCNIDAAQQLRKALLIQLNKTLQDPDKHRKLYESALKFGLCYLLKEFETPIPLETRFNLILNRFIEECQFAQAIHLESLWNQLISTLTKFDQQYQSKYKRQLEDRLCSIRSVHEEFLKQKLIKLQKLRI